MSPRRATKPPDPKSRKIPPTSRAPMRRVIIPDDSDGGAGDDADNPPRLMFKAEVVRLIGHSYPTIWKWMRNGQFPLSFDVGSKTAWRKNEIDAWIADRPRSKFKESV